MKGLTVASSNHLAHTQKFNTTFWVMCWSTGIMLSLV